ncbi:MAG TPA: hypothetical protein PKM32_08570 [Planctomycetota bacterium]|jgi:hypothetical protein|nr:hypothetical protein [Planctomycetota bacterium]
MQKVYGHDKFFDIDKESGSLGFQQYAGQFKPNSESTFVKLVDKLDSNEILVDFFFQGRLGQWSGGAHYLLEVRFAGQIYCDEITSFTQKESYMGKTSLKISKSLLGKNKVVEIENDLVGKIVIKCKKLYAQGLDAYSHDQSGKWIPYKG